MTEAAAARTEQAGGTKHGVATGPASAGAAARPARANVVDLVPGAAVNELFVVSDLQLRQGGKTGHYVTFRVADATGSVRGVFWPAEPGEAESFLAEMEDGAVARVKGDVVAFRGRTEVRVSAPNGGISPYLGKRIDPEPFIAASPVSERELKDAVEVRIGLIGDRHLRRVLRAFFADKERAAAYFRAPARLLGAHACLRGLAEEAVETARVAGAAAASIPSVDRDLVTAAALLAPAGALLAFEEEGLAHNQTRMGVLMPMPLLAADLAAKAAREAGSVPPETVERLRHVLVREPDAPRLGWASGPDALLPETIVLHHALAMSRGVPAARDSLARFEPALLEA